ncbi:ATP-binding protein [uncultured Algimonas sp.]|uniref:sensor histidine kinase n=1 Tax=uncultured Algimonas sp. TaxID=1547920 RepID=UPI00261189B2|nr:ATP-binding protein [uncultured Algimonas sp.]
MKALIARWEAFLRLDRLTTASAKFRARTVYVTALAFLATQIVNAVQMYFSYGGWILDHTLLVLAVTGLSGSALTLRYHADFDVFAVLWGGIILIGVGGTAIPAGVGINSALLSNMVVGIVLVAILGSRRSLLLYCLGAVVLTGWLHVNAAGTDIAVWSDPDYVALRNTQRTMQTGIAIVLVGVVMALLSVSLNGLFRSLERSLAAARAAEAAKTQFLADMSHELRTPLNGVLGMNQLLLRSDLDDQQRGYARIVDECGSGMIHVIDDILDLSRLEADRITLKPTPFNPAKMLDSLVALHQANARAKGLRLHLSVEPGLPDMFVGDHGRLRQIVGNLIGNAVKFTDAGFVAVSLRGQAMADERWWLNVFVQDSGIGITEDRLTRIFHRFEQAEDGLANTVRGFGLGLAICRELADLFGGEITVRSEPGRGSLFCVAVPLEVMRREDGAPPLIEDAAAPPGERLTG